jgi:cytochrome c
MRPTPRWRRRTSRRRPILVLLAASLLLAAGCGEEDTPPAHLRLAGAEPERGRAVILEHGCGACHVIPGIRGAVAWVGPPLMEWSRRAYVGGRLPNAPENLVAWLRDPQAVSPGTAMPSLGLTESEARDAAAYLYTLGRAQPVPAGMVLGPGEGGPRPEPRLRPRGDHGR